MYKTFASCAAAAIVATFAASSPASAADSRTANLAQTIDGQQNVTEEFTSQRRYRRGHRAYRHRYYGPRARYVRPRAYYAQPYAYGYPRYYQRPGISFGIGPFGFNAW